MKHSLPNSRRTVWLILVVIGAVMACRPEIPDPIWKGEHLHYGTTTTGPVCRGSFYRQELHIVEMARLLGFGLSGVVHYTRVSTSEIGEYCDGQSNDGCLNPEHDEPFAFSIRNFDFHEIAHAVAYLDGFLGARPFAEGFAQVFNDGGDPDKERAPIADVLRDFAIDDVNYYTVGLFSRFLIERHGLDPFVEFLRSTDFDDDFSRFAPIFADVFGESIEVAMAEFEAYPSCSEMSNRIAAVDCNLPLEPWEGGSVVLTSEVDCGQDDVLGPTSDGTIYTTRTFEIEEEGLYWLLPDAPSGLSGFRLVKCGSCWDAYDRILDPAKFTLEVLSPGRYYALLARHIDDPAEVSLEIAIP